MSGPNVKAEVCHLVGKKRNKQTKKQSGYFCCLFLSSSYKGSTFIHFLPFKKSGIFWSPSWIQGLKIKNKSINTNYRLQIYVSLTKIHNTTMDPGDDKPQGWTWWLGLPSTYIWLPRLIRAILAWLFYIFNAMWRTPTQFFKLRIRWRLIHPHAREPDNILFI